MTRNDSSQQGSGSSENKGKGREEQVNRSSRLSEEEKQELAREIETNPQQVGSVQETGGISGRDDYAGGDNDDMENENTGRETDR